MISNSFLLSHEASGFLGTYSSNDSTAQNI